ncbi:META domain-containing protein [Cognatishimia sp. SS12]|uniref:META domain-containing protein n=1 Tax=Cognatishimia sp. SS12 TaxID=2979465 RepID=UPI00232CF52E|nr:META domain-containing protein [Cognatishimia sp. SS12]MDC0739220.1 META domain-containing protein [Cognatishimia sp. SS12]
MRSLVLLISFIALMSCRADESLTAYGGAGTWQLQRLNGQPYAARATIAFGTNGAVTGQGACNGYGATQTAPYPWFELREMLSTQIACAQLAKEQQFFRALNAMTLAEVSGDTLILSNDSGEMMEFNLLRDG